MSKIRELIQARRAELLIELAECDEFLGIPSHGTAADLDAIPLRPAPVIEALPQDMLELQATMNRLVEGARQVRAPQARPRVASEAVLDAALQGAVCYGPNGIPVVNPNDRLVTDPKTGSVTRIPNGASGQ
jgi:hypothetical protein